MQMNTYKNFKLGRKRLSGIVPVNLFRDKSLGKKCEFLCPSKKKLIHFLKLGKPSSEIQRDDLTTGGIWFDSKKMLMF